MLEPALLQVHQIKKSFTNPEGKELLVLENINFQIKNRENQPYYESYLA